MVTQETASELPAALRGLLVDIRDTGFRSALEEILRIAADAIGRLANRDLIRYESVTSDGTGDLGLFEEIAPALAATVNEANRLVGAVEQAFPDGWRSASSDRIEAERSNRAAEILRERTRAFRGDVLQLGARLRSPFAVADRWNLLGNFQSARGKLRSEIGGMVADVANVFAEIPGAKVVPDYDADTEQALLLRRTLAKLAVALRAHNERMKRAAIEEVPALLDKLAQLVEKLPRASWWWDLRALDKREFIRFREQLGALRAAGGPPRETRHAVEGFVSFLELLAPLVNQREILKAHDRACLAEVTSLLEEAESQIEVSAGSARFPLLSALEACDALQGKDEELDAYVASVRGLPELPVAEAIQALRAHTLRLLGETL